MPFRGVAFSTSNEREKNMLFKNIAALVSKGVTLQLIINPAADGKLEVNVLPSTETGATGTNLVGKSFVATPEELDAEFADIMAGYGQSNLTLKEQLAEMKAEAEQAAAKTKEEATEKAAAKAASKPALSSPRSVSTPRRAPTLIAADPDDELEVQDADVIYPDAAAPAEQTGADPMPFTL